MVCTERERLTSIYNAAVATNNESAVILADSFANSTLIHLQHLPLPGW
jgi:hypothetical protein